MSNIQTTKYYLRNHAIDRIRARYGIGANDAVEWINDKMIDAKYVSKGHGDTVLYESNCGIRIYVDNKDNMVTTVHPAVDTSFLNDAIKREVRKMESQFTKKIRGIEADIGEENTVYAEMTINYAKARNPKTKELINKRAQAQRNKIKRMELSIERLEAERDSKTIAANHMIN